MLFTNHYTSFSSPLSTRAKTPARRNSLLLIAVLPNLASCGDLQIRGHSYCRNVAKKGTFLMSPHGDIIKVARHLIFGLIFVG